MREKEKEKEGRCVRDERGARRTERRTAALFSVLFSLCNCYCEAWMSYTNTLLRKATHASCFGKRHAAA